MKVAINCRSFLKGQYTGIGRYSFNLVKFLAQIDQENQYYLYARKSLLDRKRRIPKFEASNFVVRTDYFNRGLSKVLKDIDIYHSPSPAFFDIEHTKVIVTIHDLIYKAFPEGHTPGAVEDTEKQMQHIIQKADMVICISKSTREDMKRFFQLDEERIRLVYQGVDKNIFYPLNETKSQEAEEAIAGKGITGSFILSVGTIEPRKNLQGTIRAFSLIKQKKKFNGKLVVIGMKGWMEGPVFDLIEELHLKEDVFFLGYVSNKELAYFYNKAEVFVFPSFYEGFGFPIVEAFSCGAPVVTSNTSSCSEVASDAALCINPSRPDQIADSIINILEDEKLKEGLKQKALRRAKDFSFLETAKQTLAVYREVYTMS